MDDDRRVLRALGHLLAAVEGVTVAGCATTPAEALARDEALAPDVAVVDVRLPRLADGLELIRALSARGCAVVATSLSGAAQDVAREAGAVAFVGQGPDPEGVIRAVAGAVAA